MNSINISNINFSKLGGLVPAVVQDNKTMQVLMVGFMNKEAFRLTIESGFVTFYSRTKKRIWKKGETSNNTLKLIDIIPDCDSDSLLVLVEPQGPTCHTGNVSCFSTKEDSMKIIFELETVINDRRKVSKEGSYTSSLFEKGEIEIAKKIGEEAMEVAIASLKESKNRVISESADLMFHLIVLLQNRGVSWDDVSDELKKRRKN